MTTGQAGTAGGVRARVNRQAANKPKAKQGIKAPSAK